MQAARPGQMSLHSLQLAHCSGPAAAAAAGAPRRVGLAFRYMAAHVQQDLEPRDSGELWCLLPSSRAKLGKAWADYAGAWQCSPASRMEPQLPHLHPHNS